MKVLQVHNFYQQPGGEDQVLASEHDVLSRHGELVEQYLVHNDTIKQMPGVEIGLRTIWNADTTRSFGKRLRETRPDIIHIHNAFPVISPAIYYAAESQAVPVVQTLHNFRLVCPASTLYRDGHLCEECLNRPVPYPAVVHGCYRASRSASAAIATMLTVHRVAGTWRSKVQTYIAPSHFSKRKLVEGGLPAAKIAVKPNFLARDPEIGSGDGGFALFLGRLAEVKGVRTLLAAWQKVEGFPLKIAGDGPLRDEVMEAAMHSKQISWLGQVDRSQALALLKSAAVLIMPSEWYEGLPMTIVEAMACGTPVIASDLGSLPELVIPGVNGFRFAPGDPQALSRLVKRVLCFPESLTRLRDSCRSQYESLYTAERNYAQLKTIYERAIEEYGVETAGESTIG